MEQGQQRVWEAMLDSRYRCLVFRDGERTGRLVVTDTETHEQLLSEEVPLAYGAIFGPDVADVARWQKRAVEVVDKRTS